MGKRSEKIFFFPKEDIQTANRHMKRCLMLLVIEELQIKHVLLLLSRFICFRLCETPQTAAYQAPPSLGFSRQEHWGGVPLPSPKYVLEWLFIRKQEIASFIKDLEEREPSDVGETENRCSHCGNRMEVPLKNQNQNYHVAQQFHFWIVIQRK